MEASFPLLFALALGFTHAFEADHLVAVGNMVTRRNKIMAAVKDGIYWGLGHSSTIFVIGMLVLVGKQQIADQTFAYFEAGVGLMLILLGVHRLWLLRASEANTKEAADNGHHGSAYGIGAIHGLAGSGALLAVLVSQLTSVGSALIYLLLFGFGSVVGMLLAAGVFSLPFSRRWMTNQKVKTGLIVLSSLLCLWVGGQLILENI